MGWFKRSHQLPQAPPAPPAPQPSPAVGPSPAPLPGLPMLRLGLNVHQLTAEHIELCRRMGVRQVRTTLYAETPIAQLRALGAWAEFDLLLVLNCAPNIWHSLASNAQVFAPSAAFQLGNECDHTSGANQGVVLTAAEYSDWWASTKLALPAGTRLVTAACGSEDTGLYASKLLSRQMVPHAVGLNAYGPPPGDAILDRLRPIRAAFEVFNLAVPVWVTEFGISPRDIRRAWPTDDPAQDQWRIQQEWALVARLGAGTSFERAYGYCLDADEPQGYGIASTTTADWFERTQGGSP